MTLKSGVTGRQEDIVERLAARAVQERAGWAYEMDDSPALGLWRLLREAKAEITRLRGRAAVDPEAVEAAKAIVAASKPQGDDGAAPWPGLTQFIRLSTLTATALLASASSPHRGGALAMTPRPQVQDAGKKDAREREADLQKRFFVAHGLIHDRTTGRHITTNPDDETWWGGTITAAVDLLNHLDEQKATVAEPRGEATPPLPSRADVVEECAKVADAMASWANLAKGQGTGDVATEYYGHERAALTIAARIRALAGATSDPR